MRVVCVSDTHGLHEEALRIPDGDVLVHAGDFTDTGARDEVLAFNAFLGRLPHRYKIVIAGNHEATFDRQFYPRYWHQYGHRQQYDPDEVRALLTNALYLEDEGVLIEGFLFYGSPWQPEFCNWAFNLPRGEPLRRKWRRIPTLTDVLVTHTPPMGHGDGVGYQHVGCADLLREVETRVHPRLHVFGHVHEGYGRSESADGRTTYFNASCCTHDYEPVNAPFVFELVGPPRRGWLQTPPPSTIGTGMRRSWSTNDVSCASSLSSLSSGTEDDDVDMEDGEQETSTDQVADYALLLHERLRLCSQKAAFVEQQPTADTSTSASDGKARLREFRVDGTTSGMLFESTLKLRPVVNVQRRALRYLFSQGFTSNRDNYHTEADTHTATLDHADSSIGDSTATEMQVDANGADTPTVERRRVAALSRRVTVAVLDDLSESKDMMSGPEREQLEQASVASEALGRDSSAVDGAARTGRSRRGRRDKTLRRRSAVPKLAALTEEPAENSDGQEGSASRKQPGEASAIKTNAGTTDEKTSTALTVPPAPVECVLCKYNVPGHVHPGVASEPAVPELKTSVQEEKTEKTSTDQHPRNMGTKRLSSWF